MSHKRLFSMLSILIICLIPLVLASVQAEDNQPDGTPVAQAPDTSGQATIEFQGQITAVNSTSIIVNGLTVMLDSVAPDVNIVIGNTISVSGILQSDGTVIATVVIVINSPEVTPEVTEEPEATPEMTAEPEATEEPSATPTPDDDSDDDDTVIVIYGPVGAININVVTIYNIDVEFDADDPVLTVIQIGDVVRVEGKLKGHHQDSDNDGEHDDDDDNNNQGGTRIVIVNVINITFINVTVIIIDGQAWRDPGDCSGLPEWIDEDSAVEYLIRCTGGTNVGGGAPAPNNNNDDDDDDGNNNRRNNRNNRDNRGGDHDDDD